MIYVYLEGHNYDYEVGELLKLFYFNKDIEFITNKTLVKPQSLLIENYLYHKDETYFIKSVIRKDSYDDYETIDIKYIDIKEDNLKKKIKIAIKVSLYKLLSKNEDVSVPWGILTGIRPTKIVHELFEKGYNKDEIYNTLSSQYMLNRDKINLILDIAKLERKFIYPIDKDRYSLYISIPFCPTRCVYCSFPSNLLLKYSDVVDEYTDKLIYEMEEVSKLLKDKVINTVYIGGGTPTSIPANNLSRIINKVYEIFGRDNIKEFTVEGGRPDTLDYETLEMLKNNNIKRISINPQTMNDKTLLEIGRKHTSKDIIKVYNLAKKIGFQSINMDLIVGLPGEGAEEIKHTMEEIVKLSPENLTVHTMAIKRASKLKQNMKDYDLTKEKTIEDMLEITKKYSNKMNLKPYYMYRQKQILGNFENIGYSKVGKECIYNMVIMEEKETIIALGAGGVSKIYYPDSNRLERVPNVKNLKDYLDRIDEMIMKKKKYLNDIDSLG